jgi:hypothetical protein
VNAACISTQTRTHTHTHLYAPTILASTACVYLSTPRFPSFSHSDCHPPPPLPPFCSSPPSPSPSFPRLVRCFLFFFFSLISLFQLPHSSSLLTSFSSFSFFFAVVNSSPSPSRSSLFHSGSLPSQFQPAATRIHSLTLLTFFFPFSSPSNLLIRSLHTFHPLLCLQPCFYYDNSSPSAIESRIKTRFAASLIGMFLSSNFSQGPTEWHGACFYT